MKIKRVRIIKLILDVSKCINLFNLKLEDLYKKIRVEDFKYCNKNFMVGLSGLYYWKLLDWDMQGKLDLI